MQGNGGSDVFIITISDLMILFIALAFIGALIYLVSSRHNNPIIGSQNSSYGLIIQYLGITVFVTAIFGIITYGAAHYFAEFARGGWFQISGSSNSNLDGQTFVGLLAIVLGIPVAVSGSLYAIYISNKTNLMQEVQEQNEREFRESERAFRESQAKNEKEFQNTQLEMHKAQKQIEAKFRENEEKFRESQAKKQEEQSIKDQEFRDSQTTIQHEQARISALQERNENPVYLEAHKLADARERVTAGIVTILLYKKNIDELDQRSTNKLQENAFQDLETKLANKRTEIELSESTTITNVMEENESYHSAEKKMEAKLNRLRKEEQELMMLNESRILFSTSFKTYAETWGSTLLDNLIILNPSIYKVIESSSNNMEDSKNVISNIGEWIYQAANFQSSLDALKTRESINYSSMLFTSGVALIKFLQSDKFTDFINIALGNKDDGKKIAEIKARLISDSLIKDLDLYAEKMHKQANIPQ